MPRGAAARGPAPHAAAPQPPPTHPRPLGGPPRPAATCSLRLLDQRTLSDSTGWLQRGQAGWCNRAGTLDRDTPAIHSAAQQSRRQSTSRGATYVTIALWFFSREHRRGGTCGGSPVLKQPTGFPAQRRATLRPRAPSLREPTGGTHTPVIQPPLLSRKSLQPARSPALARALSTK